jgi:hypothetical protein
MKNENIVFIEEWTNKNNYEDPEKMKQSRKKRKRSLSAQNNVEISEHPKKNEEENQENTIILNDAFNMTEDEKRRCNNII